jgi:GH24 family phage-related lysozyme (muramidase)
MISENGIKLIKYFEGCKDGDLKVEDLQPYLAPEGYWTVAYGHLIIDPITRKPLVRDQKARALELFPHVTEEEAEKLLVADLAIAEDKVFRFVKITLQQCELDSLISCAYNLRSFPMLAAHLNKSKELFLEKILLYCHDVLGRELLGLKRRRYAEHYLFQGMTWFDILPKLKDVK